MASLVRVSGPLHIYVVNQSQTYYLGSPEDVPEYEEMPFYRGVKNSISGANLNFDETFDGFEGKLSFVLTRYDEAVLSLLRRAPNSTVIGKESPLSRGSLMYGNWTRQLIVQNSFFGTTNAQADDLPGYRFLFAKLAGHVPTPGGTGGNRIGMVWECKSKWNPTTREFEAYTNDAAISQLIPN